MLRLRRLIRNDGGNVLLTVVLVSMVVGMLASVLVRTAEQANWASASDRNHEGALAVAEAGVHQAIKRIEARLTTSYVSGIPEFTGTTEEGTYRVSAQRAGDDFVVDALGTISEGARLERSRRVKVTLSPPELFPDAGYALFSSTNLYLKNNNEIYAGDIWANDSLWVEHDALIEGSVTSAQSWIKLESGTTVVGSVWAGGRKCTTQVDDGDPLTPPDCTQGWAIDATKTTISEWARSSVSAPTCASGIGPEYSVLLGSGGNSSTISEDLFTVIDAPVVGGTYREQIDDCETVAPPAKAAPVFNFNRWNYDQSTYVECPSTACPGTEGNGAAAFNSWLSTRTSDLHGTFAVTECNGGQIKLAGAKITGNLTIITNPGPCPNGVITGARVDTDNIDDEFAPEGTLFVVVSHYLPPAGTICTDSDDEFCAIAAKNHFDATCKVSALLYADNGPVAVKNNFGGTGDERSCGTVIASGIQMKNDLELEYDPVFDRLLGFGPLSYEIARWEEAPVS